jgi:hypothetical protein
MPRTIARFVPENFNTSELEVLANTFEELFFAFDREYKRVEVVEKIDDNFMKNVRPYKNFKNDKEISEIEYEEVLGESIATIERNHLTFLQDYKVCDFYIYHMHDETLRFVIEVDFFSDAEREQFVRPHWFGKEVAEEKYSSKALWEEVSYIEEV